MQPVSESLFAEQIASIQRDEERQELLEQLYTESGRTNGLYTGLYQEYLEKK